MTLSAAFGIAGWEIGNLTRQIAVVGQNVANAGTPGYARETLGQTALAMTSLGLGARNGAVERNVDAALQAAMWRQGSDVAFAATQQSVLQAIDPVLGRPGDGSDLPSLLGRLSNAFVGLQADPSDQIRQVSVVEAAQTLAAGLRNVADAVGTARQGVQDALVADVDAANVALSQLDEVNRRVVAGRAAGQDTADLENLRDGLKDTLSSLLPARFLEQPNGSLTVVVGAGLTLGTGGRFSTTPATVGPQVYLGHGLPGVTLDGADVTAELTGGRIGADLNLRDSVLPQRQAALDEFAHTLASRFDAQGLSLFTAPDGTVPPSGSLSQAGYLGFSNGISVNPAVVGQPSLVRDGTHDVTGTPGGASSFLVNPPTGPAGFSELISRVTQFALGTQVQPGVPQPSPLASGIGPSGSLALGFQADGTLSDFASAMVAAHSAQSSTAAARAQSEQAMLAAVTAQASAVSGVSVDQEMSHLIELQNAYAANARVMTAIQSVWSTLLQVVPG